MVNTKIKSSLVIAILLISTPACGSVLPQPESTATSIIQVIPTQTQTAGQTNLPITEAGVPRITVEDAKAAVDNGEAIIVDVRSAEAYAISHIKNSVSIPLIDIENNPASLSLDKNQWIITYCT